MPILAQVLDDLNRFDLRSHLAGQKVVVGVSGGADSLGLLHVLKRLSSPLGMTLHVATLDHGLRGAAGAADADFVAQTAHAWGLPVHRAQRDVSALAGEHGLGVEEAARRVRYTFLAQVSHEVGAQTIAVGHTADDQAETILMHLIRGSGLAGLRGMLPVTPLGDDHRLPDAPPLDRIALVRPLLGISRAELNAYCAAHDLHPRHDATNEELKYFRNRLRHEVLPLLASLNPDIRETLARMGRVLAADYAQLQALVEAELQASLRGQTSDTITLDLARFRRPDLSPSLRRGLIRHATGLLAPQLRDVGFVSVEQALAIALHGSTGSQATLPGGLTLRVEYDTLVLHRPGATLPLPDWPLLSPGAEIRVRFPGVTPLPGSDWALHARWLRPDETPADFFGCSFTALLSLPEDAVLVLRTRQPGDRFAPLGLDGHTQKISDLLVNARIPAPLRNSLPLLIVNGEIAWVGLGAEGRVAEPFTVRAGSTHILWLHWERARAENWICA